MAGRRATGGSKSKPTTVPAGGHDGEPGAPGRAELAIEARGITKSFGKRAALRGVDLAVRRGEVFAFLGPNGAGKSTTMAILCTVRMPDAGTSRVAQHDCLAAPAAVRSRIGVLFQDRALDGDLSAEENLRFHAALYGMTGVAVSTAVQEGLAAMGLLGRRNDLVGTFSMGMARRLELARALLHAPEVLFLDEPTRGLDPASRTRFWHDLLEARRRHGFTVFFTTHYMDEVEHADRVAFLHDGLVVATGTPSEIRARVGNDTIVLTTPKVVEAITQLRAAGYQAHEAGGEVVVEAGAGQVAAVVRALDVPVTSATVRRPTLDQAFVQLGGGQ